MSDLSRSRNEKGFWVRGLNAFGCGSKGLGRVSGPFAYLEFFLGLDFRCLFFLLAKSSDLSRSRNEEGAWRSLGLGV